MLLLAGGCGAAGGGEGTGAVEVADPAGAVGAAEERTSGASGARTTRSGESHDTIVPGGPDTWTAGRLDVERTVEGVAVLEEVRVARNEGFDRVVFVFEDGRLPAWEVEYVDRPIRACGSGNTVDVDGDGWLHVRFEPARAYTEEGVATVMDRNRRYDLPVIRHLRGICDFEAHLEWVIGTGSPNRFRVFELREPARVVIDVRH
jgi:hypothetical protein